MVTKRSAGRREGERGAAVFIVVMVLTLLTAVGIFAVRSTSLAEVAAGYDREAAQATLVAQYATSTFAAYMATPASDTIIRSMNPPNLYCQSNMGIKAPCFKVTSSMLDTSAAQQSNDHLFDVGSMNANNLTEADFMLELTEASRSGQLNAGDNHSPVQITVTAIAQVRPTGACVNGVGTTSNAGQQVVRALISAGNQ
ncbi:MAG TPA: PilX N-terminal domain-containing pilus assembly protein [Polyangiaceae bacterium]|jgi:hypothetical protein|nr:PilX N-terminal domain-containing pilus assembly protein [Polyangiaceae bacterium]